MMKAPLEKSEAAASVGGSLRLLLGHPEDASVAVVGERLGMWEKLFRDCRRSDNLSADGASADLVLYETSASSSADAFASDMEVVRGIVSDDGCVMVFAQSDTLASAISRRNGIRELLGSIRRAYPRYESGLRRAGFSNVCSYWAYPSIDHPEELVRMNASSSGGADGAKCRPRATMGRVYLAGMPLEQRYLCTKIAAALSDHCGHPVQLAIDRIDIRRRGSVVLLLADLHLPRKVVARVVSDPATASIVAKNHEVLTALQERKLPNDLRRCLPAPLLTISCAGSTVYVETMISGVPAWVANRRALAKNIHAGAICFLRSLHEATARRKPVTTDDVDRLWREDEARLAGSSVIDPEFRVKVLRLIEKTKERLAGRVLDLVTSHGDYGYGNILVDPRSGALRGVIDWDTSRENDLPLIDVVNLYVQKERVERKSAAFQAFSALTERIANHAQEIFTAVFPASRDDIAIAVNAAFIRYAGRALQYPDIFAEEQEEFIMTSAMLQKSMPL